MKLCRKALFVKKYILTYIENCFELFCSITFMTSSETDMRFEISFFLTCLQDKFEFWERSKVLKKDFKKIHGSLKKKSETVVFLSQ